MLDRNAMHRQKSVSVHQFAMIPKPEIPRSTFMQESTHKTTFDENYLIPIYVNEVLPGDTISLRMTGFARLTTPIYPIMDTMFLDSWFFFVPCRILWSHWEEFMGQQLNPTDSISFNVPVINLTNANIPAANTIYDYMGIPVAGQLAAAGTTPINALPFRAYNLIWSEWFRDQNLQNYALFGAAGTDTDFGDGPDPSTNYALLKRAKRHDYFTGCLPWTQKGTSPPLLISGNATVKTSNTPTFTGGQPAVQVLNVGGGNPTAGMALTLRNPSAFTGNVSSVAAAANPSSSDFYFSNLYADMSTIASNTINTLRLNFQIQKLLERDARGGTRYAESVMAHFGVRSPDSRLQRPEYLGGGSTPVNIAPIPQTSATGLTGSNVTPMGTLAGYGTMLAQGHGFTQSFTEHGYILGLINIRADINYQQGLRKLYSRSTRYDFYYPVFAHIGEQAVLNKEIYCIGDGGTQDNAAFGYQERWGEMRYMPSMITGQFRSTYATPLDAWHLAEKFTALPTLAATFIQQNTPISRISAVATTGAHFIGDFLFQARCTRLMPLYSVPGNIDKF